jgi:hypothetical protein
MKYVEGETGRGDGLRGLLAKVTVSWHERRLAARVRRASRPPAAPRVPRSALGAALDARSAVRAGIRLDDFLRQRLARYAIRLPVPLEALPVTVDVEGGEAVVRARPIPGVRGPRLGDAAPARAPAADGFLAEGALREGEARLAALADRARAASERADAVERELAAALASGAVVARPAIDATAEQLGRPAVEPAWPAHGLRTLAGILLAAETWHFAGTALSRAGVAQDALDAALRTSPLPAGLALLAAGAAAASAFAFAWLALTRGAEAAAATPAGHRGRLFLAWAAGSALLVPSVAAAATAADPVSGLVLAATLPFAGAALWRGAGALEARRAGALGAVLAWDRERAREELERGRRVEACARADADARAAEGRREKAAARLRALQREAIAEARIAEASARAAATRLDRLAEGLAAALEQDRYAFLRTAGEHARPAPERPALSRVAPERFGAAG